MVATATHPWSLVGPWYRWEDGAGPRPGEPLIGRESRPTIQKYAWPEFVEAFLTEPQRSLLWRDEDRDALDGTRKLFLQTHDRFYVVVCELHCDRPGFPKVDRRQVCEAGFVVRRNVAGLESGLMAEAAEAVREIRRLRTERSLLAARDKAAVRRARKKSGKQQGLVRNTLRQSRQSRIDALDSSIETLRQRIEGWRAIGRVWTRIEGWFPTEIGGVGNWLAISDPYPGLTEEVFPLHPLVPDPADEENSGHRGSIWFGVVPVGSSDLDEQSGPRFDDRHRYEIECFVRRHDQECRKRNGERDCGGEVVWSRPTEPYRLAPHFDLDGTSHKPVIIQLPDLKALEAKATSLDIGQGVGVGMRAPPDSTLEFDVASGETLPSGGSAGGGTQICFFAIPLITIVAMFLLKLFLPIVVFIFQLWFLLRLKLCIPPSLSIDADFAAALEVELEKPVFDASVEVEVDLGVTKTLEAGLLEITATFRQDLGQGFEDSGDHAAMARFALDQSTDFSSQLSEDAKEGMDLAKPVGSAVIEGTLGGPDLEFYEVLEWPAS